MYQQVAPTEIYVKKNKTKTVTNQPYLQLTTIYIPSSVQTPDASFSLLTSNVQDQVCTLYFGIFSDGGIYVKSDLVADTQDRTQYIVSTVFVCVSV